LTVAVGSLGSGGDEGNGESKERCDAALEHPEMSLSSCGIAYCRTCPAPSRSPGRLSGCGCRCLRLAGRAGGDGFVTAPMLPAAAAPYFLVAMCLSRVAAAARGASARAAAAVVSAAVMASQEVLQLLLFLLLLLPSCWLLYKLLHLLLLQLLL
jgi:hypothetical protein